MGQIDFSSLGGDKVLYQTLRENASVQDAMMVAESFEDVKVAIDALNVKYTAEQLEFFKQKFEAKLG